MYLCTLCGNYHGGRSCPGLGPTREQRLEKAVREIRELIAPWGDNERARMVRSILDQNRV